MPGKGRKRKATRKKAKENAPIVPLVIKNKFLNNSDTVIHGIVEKIISLSITRSFKQHVESKFNDKCFNFLKNTIDLSLNLNFIPHDIDETSTENSKNISINFLCEDIDPIKNTTKIDSKSKINNINQDINLNEVFFNNDIDGENCWDILEEPKSSFLDRYASTMINYIDIKKSDKNGKIDALEAVPEELSQNSILKGKEKLKENENNITNVTPTRKSQNRRPTVKENTNKERKNTRRNMYDVMNAFPYYDILEDNDHYVEDNSLIDFDSLRKELSEKEKLKYEEMLKKKANKKKEVFDIKSIIGNNNNKQYIGKKVTVDPNGNVVFIKNLPLNKLSKDFSLAKTNLKTVKEKNEIKKEKKLIRNNNSNKSVNQELNLQKGNIDNEKEKNFETIKNQGKKNVNILPKIEKKIIENKSNIPEEIKIKKEPIVPCGSNYNLMNMEIGVSLREDDKFKTGGKDFFLKYKKYSKDIYEQKLKDSIEANSLLKTHVQFDTNDEEETNNNFNVSKPLNNESYNYNTNNFNQSYGFNRSVTQNNILKPDIQSKYLMTSTGNFGSNVLNATSMNPNIKLANISSLMTSMDRLNLITEREEKRAKKTQNYFNRKNMLKKLVINDNNKNSNKLNEINQFTKEILKNDDWSKKLTLTNKSSNRGFLSQSKITKPNNREILREIGFGGKIMRNRSRGLVVPISPFTETLDFFKH